MTGKNDRCPRCGALILDTDRFCPQCGASLKPIKSIDEAWQPGTVPATIGQLKAFCDYNGMPLERMRFFLDVDCREPRAFGIFRERDQFIVYKDKNDGSRAVRYHGPDEAFAVGELYAKLLDECHRRNIFPGESPKEEAEREKKAKRQFIITAIGMMIVFAAIAFFIIRSDDLAHEDDGYYRYEDPGLYYLYGSDWYYGDDDDWVYLDSAPYGEGEYLGDDYDSSWGGSSFQDSDTWEQLQEESRTSDSDYDSWDSSDTDWNTDW